MIGLFFTFGCASIPQAGSSLDEVKFSIFPHIVEREGKYYLRYQIKVDDDQRPSLVRVVYSKIVNDKAYYYFSIPISHFERGFLVERPLAEDNFTEYAKRDAVYWLNKDTSEVKLVVKEE